MRKAALTLFIGLTLFMTGCVSLPVTPNAQQAQRTADKFLTALQEGRYADSYAFFSQRLKKEVPWGRHLQIMQALAHDLGPMTNYHTVVMPFLARSSLEQKLMVADSADLQRSTYELDFRGGSVVARLDLMPEDGQEKVLVFELIWSTLQDQKGMAKRLRSLGY